MHEIDECPFCKTKYIKFFDIVFRIMENDNLPKDCIVISNNDPDSKPIIIKGIKNETK
jgi:hypothetical protein